MAIIWFLLKKLSRPCGNSIVWFGFMVFNATFTNISVISWRSVLLLEETEGHRKTSNLLQVTTDCIGSCKSNYPTITATGAPSLWEYILKLFLSETTEPFDRKPGWNVPCMMIYHMYVWVFFDRNLKQLPRQTKFVI